jgi:hypothetical protein
VSLLLWTLESLCQYPVAGSVNPSCSSFCSSFFSLFFFLFIMRARVLESVRYVEYPQRYLASVHFVLLFSHWNCINSLCCCTPVLSVLKSEFIFSVFIMNEQMLLITKWLLQLRQNLCCVSYEPSTASWTRMGNGGISPHILNLGTRWAWVASFALCPLF